MDKNFWQGKRIFLTGATGFKGAWLSIWLYQMGAKVAGFSLPQTEAKSLYKVAGVGEMITHIDGDICDIDSLRTAMMVSEPDIVIHMAAQALVKNSYHDPLATYMTNVMGTAHVLECARISKNIRAIVVVTTDKCYENREWCWGYREDEALGGYDPYSSSKACAEFVAAAYRRSFLAQQGVAVATARAGNVIGGGDWAQDRLIPDCIRALERRTGVVLRNPHSIRPWQYVLEPLHGYLLLAERLFSDGASWAEGWNFGPTEQACICVEEVVQKLCEQLNGEYTVDCGEQLLHEACFLKLDSSKARQSLGWSTQLDIDESLQWTADWYRAYMQGKDMREFTASQICAYSKRLLHAF